MKLYERLPDCVIVGKKRVKVDLDFRNVLRMAETLGRNDMTSEAREYVALSFVCRGRPPKIPGLLEELKKLLFPGLGKKQDGKRITSFEQDAGLIRTAFRQVYGVDLWRDRLHWIEFTEMLNGIPDGNRYADVLGIRARELPEPTKYNAKEREWLIRAKESVALELTDEEREQQYRQDVRKVFDAVLPFATKGSD